MKFNPFRRKPTESVTRPSVSISSKAYDLYVHGVSIADIAVQLEVDTADVLEEISNVERNRG